MTNTALARSIVRIVPMAAVVALGVTAAGAEERSLDRLLAAIERQKIVTTPLRAEGSIEIDGASGKVTDRIAIRAGKGSGNPLFVALEKSAVRALVVGGAMHVAVSGKPSKATLATALGETRFVVEDLLPFDPARCMGVHVVDDLPDGLTIRCDPKADSKTPYSLAVWKFDRERGVPLQVLFYKKTLSNLVKRLKADDYVQVGERWRPRRIVLQDYELGAKDVVSLEWKEDADGAADLFAAESFAGAPLSPAK